MSTSVAGRPVEIWDTKTTDERSRLILRIIPRSVSNINRASLYSAASLVAPVFTMKMPVLSEYVRSKYSPRFNAA